MEPRISLSDVAHNRDPLLPPHMIDAGSRLSSDRLDGGDEVSWRDTDGGVELRLVSPPGGRHEYDTPHKHPVTRTPSFAWLGVAALVSIVVLSAVAVTVLLTSHGSLVDRWQVLNVNIQPQVYLSILTTAMDGLMLFALADVAMITYSQVAAHGSTLRGIFDLYESHSYIGALKNLVHLRWNRLAVVSVLCLVSTIRGPLFQRASLIDSNAVHKISAEQELHVAQLLPPRYLFPNYSITSTTFDAIWNQYSENSPIHLQFDAEKCGERCVGSVQGYGFDIECADLTSMSWNSSELRDRFVSEDNNALDVIASFNSSSHLPNTNNDSNDFRSSAAAEARGSFEVFNLFKREPICGGNVFINRCSLHHAIIKYEVELTNGTVRLLHDHWQNDTVVAQVPTWIDEETLDLEWGPTAHWVRWYNLEFQQEVAIYSNGDNMVAGGSLRMLLAKRFIHGDINAVNCSTTFDDPTQYVLDKLRNIAFRTAVAAASTPDNAILFGAAPTKIVSGLPLIQNWTQQVHLVGEKHVVVFQISIPYLACAVAASLLSVLAMAPTYWVLWRRRVDVLTFNPLEVAHVFGAPVLEDADSAKTMQNYVRRESGLRRIRYVAADNPQCSRIRSC